MIGEEMFWGKAGERRGRGGEKQIKKQKAKIKNQKWGGGRRSARQRVGVQGGGAFYAEPLHEMGADWADV